MSVLQLTVSTAFVTGFGSVARVWICSCEPEERQNHVQEVV